MAKATAQINWDLCQPNECSTDGRCLAKAICKKKTLKQDEPGDGPYALGPCVACGECLSACPYGAIKLS